MNIGKKISTMKDSLGFKNYQEFGKAIGINGDWLNELSKKLSIQTVDITRLITVCDYCNISLGWLLSDEDTDTFTAKTNLSEDDIGVQLDKLMYRVDKGKDLKFYGYDMNKIKQLAYDSLDSVKGFLKSNI